MPKIMTRRAVRSDETAYELFNRREARRRLAAYGHDARIQDDDAPRDLVALRKRIAPCLEQIAKLNAIRNDADAIDVAADVLDRLQKRVVATPLIGPRAAALLLRFAGFEAATSADPTLALAAIRRLVPVLGLIGQNMAYLAEIARTAQRQPGRLGLAGKRVQS